MSPPRYLIDTNVFIGLEDDREIHPNFSSLVNLTSTHKIGIFIHEAAKDDIARDNDQARRRISLSKLEKFQTLSKVRDLTADQLSDQFGELRKPNDEVDAALLHALSIDAADFLVTEDRGLHVRARKHAPELSRRILFVADAVSLLKSTYEQVEVPIRYVEEVEAHTIPKDDSIFESLREDYDGFDAWWTEKCVKNLRKCWIVSDEGIAGIVVRKEEQPNKTDATMPAEKILKICTFKVRPENRGLKLGELLLKQVFWFAQGNGYDLVYITTFSRQVALIDLLEYYGFQLTQEREDGELVYEKSFSKTKAQAEENDSFFDVARMNYPRFCTSKEVEAYGIPIKEAYHDELFPELNNNPQRSLFEAVGLGRGARRPGNTIRKVYLCRAPAKLEQPGALLFFYKGVSDNSPSQAITTVGIFEDMKWAHSTAELMRLAGGRSVYSEVQLQDWNATEKKPVKVINFLLAGYLPQEIQLSELKEMELIRKHPWQSITQIPRQKLEKILLRLDLGFEV